MALVSMGATPAYAWHDTGHMITAQIAYDELTASARREVDRLVSVLAEMPPRREHAVTASVWADDLKGQGVEAFNAWHYVNYPLSADDTTTVPESSENVVWAIDQAVATLRGDGDDFAKALMLRFLLHFVGDVHQPLHCVNRFSATNPDGDRGGGEFSLKHPTANLHAYWDAGADLFGPVDPTTSWQEVIRKWSDGIKHRIPKARVPEWQEQSVETWAREAFALAAEVVYYGIDEGNKPSRKYRKRAQRVIRQQLAVGGYRLGALLNEIFDAPGN